MKIEKLLLATLFVISFSGLSFAQGEAQPNECTRFKAIAGNAYQAKEYEKVTMFYIKALNECEKLELKFYNPFIYAVQKSYSNAKGDSVARAAYLDTLVMVYEAGQEAHGMQIDWQTYLGYYYLAQGNPGGMNKADEALKLGVHHQKAEISKSFLQQYAANLFNLWVQEQDEKVKAEYKKRLITEYFKLSEYANEGAMGPEMLTFLSDIITNVATDCASILPDINAFMKELPQELEAKKATVNNFMALLENTDCTKSAEYAMLVDTIIAIDPSVGAVLAKAKLQVSQGNSSAAINTFKEALSMVESAEEKSDIELEIANLYFRAGSYKAAHNAGLAITGRNSARGYEIAARSVNAMMNDCGVSTFERKANNYYAVELAEKSGNSSLVSSLKSQCPSSSDIFNEDKSVGESVTLSCWGKNYTIKTY
jgi:tetratricopeptide (TPR) repeat protein